MNLAMLLRGHGDAASAAEADDLLRKAAETGDPVAIQLLKNPDWDMTNLTQSAGPASGTPPDVRFMRLDGPFVASSCLLKAG